MFRHPIGLLIDVDRQLSIAALPEVCVVYAVSQVSDRFGHYR